MGRSTGTTWPSLFDGRVELRGVLRLHFKMLLAPWLRIEFKKRVIYKRYYQYMQTPCAVLRVRYVSWWQWTTQKSGSSTRTVLRQIHRVGTWIVRASRLMCRYHCFLVPSCDMLSVNSHPVLRCGGTFVAPSEINIKKVSIPSKHISTQYFCIDL